MNLILFDSSELAAPLSRQDPRAEHILSVLRRVAGDTFDAGLINGPRGKGMVVAITPGDLTLAFTWTVTPPPLDPITLVLGLPRPQTARKILHEATALGVGALHFFASEKGERSYAQSTLWSSGEWRRHVIAGAEQAFDTRLPDVTTKFAFAEILAALPAGGSRIALDNYEAPVRLSECHLSANTAVTLAFGPERGWSTTERDQLRAHGFVLAHLGARVLRTETACTAALAIIRAKLGSM